MTRASGAFSASEAASVTGVPLKQVHRIVDADLLEGAVKTSAGARLITSRGLVGLKFAHETADLLTPAARRRFVKRLIDRPEEKKVEENALVVDVRPMETAVRRGLGALERANKLAAIDKQILGGTPCFKGTRIPIHDIAEMIANGDEKSAILTAYPQLTAEQVDLAVVYADAYPRRGRPRRRIPGKRVSVQKLKLRDLASRS